jgi:hypothetical protein
MGRVAAGASGALLLVIVQYEIWQCNVCARRW